MGLLTAALAEGVFPAVEAFGAAAGAEGAGGARPLLPAVVTVLALCG